LNADQQKTTKDLLLSRFKEEPVTIVKKNIADVIGSLGSILIPNKEWNELFQFIFQATQSDNLAEKELAMILLSVIIEYFTDEEIKLYYEQLNPIVENYLKSDIPSLKTLSVETVNNLAQTPAAFTVFKKHKDLIGLVLNALDHSNEDLLLKIFGTLTDLSEIKKILKPHLPNIVEKALMISGNREFGDNLRQVTLLLLQMISENYARSMIKTHGMNFVDKIIEVGFSIASEPAEDYEG